MSTYITLSHLHVQNANCVSGFTYGFPAVTHFLGYVHALSRKLEQSHQITLGGGAITCHQHQVHAYQPKGYGDFIFALTRNPLTKAGKTAPIIEEGKMHLTVSLVVECKGLNVNEEERKALQEHIHHLCLTQKLAGGVINHLKETVIESASTEEAEASLTQTIRRRLLPGFLLLDRSQYLKKHLSILQEDKPDAELLDAWLDFSALKYQAEKPEDKEITDKTKVNWQYIPKPESGYLVPITTGYKALSEVYAAGEIPNTRDPKTPLCFVEAAYSVGEWQSPHRMKDIENTLWHYHASEGWYLCVNKTNIETNTIEHEEDNFDFLKY